MNDFLSLSVLNAYITDLKIRDPSREENETKEWDGFTKCYFIHKL